MGVLLRARETKLRLLSFLADNATLKPADVRRRQLAWRVRQGGGVLEESRAPACFKLLDKSAHDSCLSRWDTIGVCKHCSRVKASMSADHCRPRLPEATALARVISQDIGTGSLWPVLPRTPTNHRFGRAR